MRMLFTDFLKSLHNVNPTLIEGIQKGYKLINEAYEDYGLDDEDSLPSGSFDDDVIENPNEFEHRNYSGKRYMLEIDPDWQQAIHFIGHRYESGDAFFDLVVDYLRKNDEWGEGKTVVAELPENVAWELREMFCDEDGNIDRSATGMLADSILVKLQTFFDSLDL